MVATSHSQSLSEFKENAAETLTRLNESGEVEVITVDGQARAVLVPPDVYEGLINSLNFETNEEDIENMSISLKQIEEGKSMSFEEAFAEIRAELLAMKEKAEATSVNL